MWKYVFLTILITGCSSVENQSERLVPARPVSSILYDTMSGTIHGAWEVALSPLEDINVKRKPIPAQLQKIVENPYILPPQITCEKINKEIAELDSLLGPDICTPGNPTGMGISRKGEYIEKGAGAARNQMVSMVGDKVNIIPFRGAIRYVSGADKYSKLFEKSYEAGRLRRAFLKGIGSSIGEHCLN